MFCCTGQLLEGYEQENVKAGSRDFEVGARKQPDKGPFVGGGGGEGGTRCVTSDKENNLNISKLTSFK